MIIGDIDGYTKENNGNKYLTFASTDKDIKKIYKTLG